METLTKFEALLGELEPYNPKSVTIKKALADAGVTDVEASYDAQTDKRNIAVAAVKVLSKMLALSSESIGKSSSGYSVEGLRQRINALCKENGLDVSDFVEISSITDGSNLW